VDWLSGRSREIRLDHAYTLKKKAGLKKKGGTNG